MNIYVQWLTSEPKRVQAPVFYISSFHHKWQNCVCFPGTTNMLSKSPVSFHISNHHWHFFFPPGTVFSLLVFSTTLRFWKQDVYPFQSCFFSLSLSTFLNTHCTSLCVPWQNLHMQKTSSWTIAFLITIFRTWNALQIL